MKGFQTFEYPITDLVEALSERSKGSISQKMKTEWLREGSKEVYKINEFDKAELLVTYIMHHSNSFKTKEDLQTFLMGYSDRIFNTKIPLEEIDERVKRLSKLLRITSTPRIRAKLAFLS